MSLRKCRKLMTFKSDDFHSILVPETPIKDSKLTRLTEVFGTSRSIDALSKALETANGELDLAIMYAAVEPNQDIAVDLGVEAHLEQQPKKRKLIKKKDLEAMSGKVDSMANKDNSKDSESLASTANDLSYNDSAQKVITIDDDSAEKVISINDSENVLNDQETDNETDSEESEQEQGTFEAATVLYFNSCSSEQLAETTGCSHDDATFIIGQRPFDSFKHLKESLAMTRRKYVAILDRYVDMMMGFAKVDQLIGETRVYGDSIKDTLKSWGFTSENSISGELSMIDLPKNPNVESTLENVSFIHTQPDFIPAPLSLKSYQLVGISWLSLLYEKNLSGILADEMGLGKTAQVITFLGHLKNQGIQGPHLIVAPVSTLENWAREIERWAPCLSYRVYYGSQSERGEVQVDIMSQLSDLNVVLTTYAMATGNKDDRMFLRKLGCSSLILDEGHMIKNMESARYKYLSMYQVKFRLLMTGTPLQNDLMELLSLLTFIMPELFSDDMDVFSKIFCRKKTTSSTTDNLLSKQRVIRAKEMMTPFILRRRKDQVLKDLPQKIISIRTCDKTPLQKEVYQSIVVESRRKYLLEAENVKNDSKSFAKNRQFSSKVMSNYIMQLRKAANHPLLIRNHYTDDLLSKMTKQIMREPEYCDANPEYIYEDMQYMSDFELHQLCKKFKSVRSFQLNKEQWMDSGKVQELQKLLPKMKADGDRILIFSQFVIMLDILEEVMTTLGMEYLRLDGSTHVGDRQGLIDDFNNNSQVTVFLISTKAGGVGINLTSANVVIIYDMDFNPHNDKQAEDRAHRVGQIRDVNVLKLVTLSSVEEHIYRSAEMKIKLDEKIRETEAENSDTEWLDETVMEALRNELRGD